MTAFYNENDPRAAACLRELIEQGLIAPGVVDERSIEDIKPCELEQFTQCHFFAGIGVWSYSLRRAGWPDDRPVWTGSCPCQPFSAAGKGGGFVDERHLWPALFHLVSVCKPKSFFGEQVASKDGLAWLDLVQSDMEAAGYAFGALDLCAASVGAPHIRQRLYFVANADHTRPQGRPFLPERAGQRAAGQNSVAGELADAHGQRPPPGQWHDTGPRYRRPTATTRGDGRPGPVNGFWRAADWIGCTDDKWRAVEPGTFPLAHGAPARVGRLRGYGNAIVAPLAAEFIKACLDVQDAA